MNQITIVQPRATGILHGSAENTIFGGAEMQAVHLALLLSENLTVNFIANRSDYKKKEQFSGLNVVFTYSRKAASIRYIRFIFPRLICNLKALWKSNSSVYYQRGPGELTGVTAVFCKIFQRKFVYAVSGNGELINLKEKIPNRFSRYLYKLGLYLSDSIACQTDRQKELLKPVYGSKTVVIKNIFPGSILKGNEHPPEHILNIGALRPLKRQTHFIELAQHFSNEKFFCVGGGKSDYAASLTEKAKQVMNLEMTGHLQHKEVQVLLQKSYCLVNCSDNEGFPNVFLEAWAHHIPVVSMGFDPDGIIEKHSLGFVVSGMEELKDAVQRYIENPDIRKQHGLNGKKYVEQHHSGTSVLKQISSLIA